ncbi:MAG: bactofilin family protein [Chthoniobacterales bacterium]
MFSPTRKPEPTSPPTREPSNGTAPASAPAPARPAPRTGGALSSGVTIKGSLKFDSEFDIDCALEGTIDSTGRLNIGKNAQINGEVRVGSVTVHGTVDGNVTATERCELRAGCTLRGDIEAPRLVVDDDATFIGSAKITSRAKQAAAT